MMDTEKFILVGNSLFLDFVNTKILRNGEPFDLLENLADFLAWTVSVELLEKPQAENLLAVWQGDTSSFGEILKFRQMLFEMAEDITHGKKVGAEIVKALNDRMRTPAGYNEIRMTGDGFVKRFRPDFSEPVQILTPIAESAADFLYFGNFDHLKKCENDECVLYFYDATKNHSRRWCSMASCGNRAKANAFYQRKKAELKR